MAGQDTFSASAIPCPIRWSGRFFVGLSSYAGNRYGAIEADIAVPPIRTLSTFSHPLCLIFPYRIYTAVTLIVTHICFYPYPLLPSSSRIYFVFHIVAELLVWPTTIGGDASSGIVASTDGAPNGHIENQVQHRTGYIDGFLDAMGLSHLLEDAA